jgi:subfamily B ATP-binding cassette protein HlyB/CyaB
MDTGLNTLIAIARYHQLHAEPEQIARRFGQPGRPFTDCELLQAAKVLGLKAKRLTLSLKELDNSALPAIAKLKDGNYVILARVVKIDPHMGRQPQQTGVLMHDLRESNPKSLALEDFSAICSSELILLAKSEGLQRKFNTAWFIFSHIKYRKPFTEALIASFFLQLFALITPLFFLVVLDKVLVHHGFSTLDTLAMGFFVLVVFDALMGGIRDYLVSHTAIRVDVTLSSRLYNHLLALPMAYFESRQVGQNIALVRELDTIRNFIAGTALTGVIDLFFVFVFLGVMWYYSPSLTWIVLASIPFYVALIIFITPILRFHLDNKFKHGEANTAFLAESITGIGAVKSIAVESQMLRKLEYHLANVVHASFRSQNLNSVANQVAGLINKLLILGIIWWGAHLAIANELTVGQLVAFSMLAGRVSNPILKLVQQWQDFQQAGISLARLSDILNTPREPGFNPNRSRLPALKGEVTLENIRFRYRYDGPVILDDLSLHCRPGEVIGIVGHSGSGKSTITKLIQRLYIPETGRVLIDGVDLSMIDAVWLRQQIGAVLQENFLFNRTIRENIALANPALPLEQVVHAAKLSGAHEFIVDLPEGYNTLVGEQGSKLSGGERQRLAIARALIGNPRLLVLDEATNTLDHESQRLILDNMAAICQGRTVFIIASRLSTVRQCDRIIVLEKGRVVEQGDHDGLLKANGYYARLHCYQNYTPVLRQVPNRDEVQGPERKTNIDDCKDRRGLDVVYKRKAHSIQGIVSGGIEIEEVDESWAIEMLEALEREELGDDNRAELS